MSIRQLPQDVVDKLKSSVVITSLHDVATGLLKNSLDAAATKVNITVDFARGNCTVEDNGRGIEPDEFKDSGGLGKLHHTSKTPLSANLHGKHGEFLASLATLSLLSVASRHHRHASHNSILIHNSAILSRHLPAPVEQHLRAFDHGSRVVVRDLFGSMPVRIKQRAALMSEHFYLDREWSRLIAEAVAVLLAWPSDVSVSLRESASQREVRLRPPETPDITARTSRLMTQASMAGSAYQDDWVPLSASAANVSMKGCISTHPMATRRAQFISIGVQPLANLHGTNVVYEEINKLFNNSSFGVLDQGSDERSGGSLNKDFKGRKSVDRWPMFYFRVRLHNSSLHNLDEIMDDRSNELAAMMDLLKAVCYGFLKKHHYRPRKLRMSTEESVFSTSKTVGRATVTPQKRSVSAMETHSSGSAVMRKEERASRSESPFDAWQRVKVGHAARKTTTPRHLPSETSRISSTASEKERLIGKGGVLLRKPFDDLVDETEGLMMSSSHFESPRSTEALRPQQCPVRKYESSSSTTGQLSQRANLAKRSKVEPSGWLKDIVKKWENPVFENAPLAVPRMYKGSSAPVGDPRPGTSSNYFADSAETCGITFESNSMDMDGRISKDALVQAEVVSQVDLKFILIKLPLDAAAEKPSEKMASLALVMLDQHAVDERCQLEDLMASYFVLRPDGTLSADVVNLERPLKFEVREQEANLLAALRAHFETWGIVFDFDSDGTSRSKSTQAISITHLPPSIAQRCITEPHRLITILRSEAHSLERPPSPPVPNSSQHPWVSYFHGCPRGILELLHSRSCRSAIMFNDVLSKEECENLVQRVAKCAFPFQCAHGRPSMAPVLDLGMDQEGGNSEGKGFDLNWKRWMQEDTE